MSTSDIFERGDIIGGLPPLARDNWLCECELALEEILPGDTVLQAGCTSGGRMIALKERRQGLDISGLDIDPVLLGRAGRRLPGARFILGDIGNPGLKERFDVVLCLDNMLGYLKDEKKALAEMKNLAKKKLIVSVYGDGFTDSVARDYFKSIGTAVERMEPGVIFTKEFRVRRYSEKGILSLVGNCKMTGTPLGWFCVWEPGDPL